MFWGRRFMHKLFHVLARYSIVGLFLLLEIASFALFVGNGRYAGSVFFSDMYFDIEETIKAVEESGMRAAYSNSVRSVKFSGRWNIASFRKAG